MVFERVAPVRIVSPCVQVCRIDESGLCEGCARTLDEIVRWSSMGEVERDRVLIDLRRRRA